MNFNILSFLVLILAITLTIWYLGLLWRRRKMYIYSWNVPGPLSFPIIGMTYKFIGRVDDILNVLDEIINNYPSIMKTWLGPYLTYSLKDPEDIKVVLTSSHCLEKNFVYKGIKKYIGVGLLTASVPKWKKHRKLIRSSFSQKVLDSFVEIFVEKATIFTKMLQSQTGQKDIDISYYMKAMSFDVIGETSMGVKLNNMQGGNRNFTDNFDRALELLSLQMFKVWYQVEWIWKLNPLSRELDKCARFCLDTVADIVKMKQQMLVRREVQRKDSSTQHNEEGEDRKRVALLDIILENPELTEKEIVDEIIIILAAGMDTTATTVCFCFEMLGMHPEVQMKVYEEVIDVVGEERSVESSDLPNLKYLERVLKETLRIFPVVIFFSRRTEKDVDLGHHIIPEGANIIFNIMNIHRNPKYWPDPIKFDPDRFLPEEIAKRSPCSYIPFSYGPRNCIGSSYALMSLKSIVATTIRKYKIFSQYQSVEEIKIKTSFISHPQQGFKVYVENR